MTPGPSVWLWVSDMPGRARGFKRGGAELGPRDRERGHPTVLSVGGEPLKPSTQLQLRHLVAVARGSRVLKYSLG